MMGGEIGIKYIENVFGAHKVNKCGILFNATNLLGYDLQNKLFFIFKIEYWVGYMEISKIFIIKCCLGVECEKSSVLI